MQSHIDQLFSRLSNSGGGVGDGADDNKSKSETLWTKAVTDLVYRMLELQEREQREVNEDAFAVLQHNSELIDMALFSPRARIKYASERTATTTARAKSTEVSGSSASGSKRTSSGQSLGAMRDDLKSGKQTSSSSSSASSAAAESSSSSWNEFGMQCASCGSKNTFIVGSNFQQTKCETWGSKSFDESELLVCISCGHKSSI